MTTRKHPRSMADAFGPYTSHQLSAMPSPMPLYDRIICVLAALVVLAVFLGVL